MKPMTLEWQKLLESSYRIPRKQSKETRNTINMFTFPISHNGFVVAGVSLVAGLSKSLDYHIFDQGNIHVILTPATMTCRPVDFELETDFENGVLISIIHLSRATRDMTVSPRACLLIL